MAENKKMVEAITSMEEDFGKWYTDVVKKADLIDYSSVKGCMIIRPYGYAIWENIQKLLDARFKKTGGVTISINGSECKICDRLHQFIRFFHASHFLCCYLARVFHSISKTTCVFTVQCWCFFNWSCHSFVLRICGCIIPLFYLTLQNYK